jgi:hypothetical protein
MLGLLSRRLSFGLGRSRPSTSFSIHLLLLLLVIRCCDSMAV